MHLRHLRLDRPGLRQGGRWVWRRSRLRRLPGGAGEHAGAGAGGDLHPRGRALRQRRAVLRLALPGPELRRPGHEDLPGGLRCLTGSSARPAASLDSCGRVKGQDGVPCARLAFPRTLAGLTVAFI